MVRKQKDKWLQQQYKYNDNLSGCYKFEVSKRKTDDEKLFWGTEDCHRPHKRPGSYIHFLP